MTRRLPTLLVAATLLAAGGTAALAHWNTGEMRHHHGGEAMALFRGVDLTDAQKAQAHQIFAGEHDQARALFGQMRDLHRQIAARLLAPGALAEADLQPLVAQEQQLRAQLDGQHLTEALQLRALLTPDQLARAATVHAKLADLHAQEHALLGGDHPE